MARDIQSWVNQCDSCHLLSTSLGYDFIWVCVDRLSKIVHLKAIYKTITASVLARIFRNKIFCLHGLSRYIVSDRDLLFTAAFCTLHQLLGVQLCMSTRDHLLPDGQIENANGILEGTLRHVTVHFVGPYQRDWDQHLPIAKFECERL
jgi:hypothetical protein